MKAFGPLYVDVIRYYHKRLLPIVEKGWTQETDFPYRKSKFCFVFRLPFTTPGFVLGLWNKNTEIVFEEDADLLLSNALKARSMGLSTEEIDEW
jgi:hypothetical protein